MKKTSSVGSHVFNATPGGAAEPAGEDAAAEDSKLSDQVQRAADRLARGMTAQSRTRPDQSSSDKGRWVERTTLLFHSSVI